MIYKSVCIPDCPNHCFERIVDTGISKNVIEGIEPKARSYGFGRSTVDLLRYSKRLKRHAHTAHGNYYTEKWTHCPHCGAELEG